MIVIYDRQNIFKYRPQVDEMSYHLQAVSITPSIIAGTYYLCNHFKAPRLLNMTTVSIMDLNMTLNKNVIPIASFFYAEWRYVECLGTSFKLYT